MNFFKRALTSIKRTPVKSLLLFLMIFILSSVVSGAISVRNAIYTTDLSLRRNMRPIILLAESWYFPPETFSEVEGNFNFSGLDVFYELGQLPYVEFFDYSMRTMMTSTELAIWYPRSREEVTPLIGSANPELGEYFTLRGASNSEFIDLRQGLIEIVAGETFTEAQLMAGQGVTIISRQLAIQNDLAIGDRIQLNSLDTGIDENGEFLFYMGELNEFEIIGLFDVVGMEEIEFGSIGEWTLYDMNAFLRTNQIYVPNVIVRGDNEAHSRRFSAMLESLGEEVDWENFSYTYHISPIYVLHEPLYISNFREAAQPLLGNFWGMSDGSNRFEPITNSMATMGEIANGALIGAVVAAFIIGGLMITLLLHDRRHEIGIYLALGEKKGKVLNQILIEILMVTLVAITASLFVGTFVSTHLSQELLRNEIADLTVTPNTLFSGELIEPWERAGLPSPMSGEEMLEFYDVSLSGATVASFYVVSLAIVSLSTVIPIVYIMKLEPKDILMKGSVG